MNFALLVAGGSPAPVRAPRLLGLYLLLLLMAAIEAFEGLSHVPILFSAGAALAFGIGVFFHGF